MRLRERGGKMCWKKLRVEVGGDKVQDYRDSAHYTMQEKGWFSLID
jgi:hypothetical protein